MVLGPCKCVFPLMVCFHDFLVCIAKSTIPRLLIFDGFLIRELLHSVNNGYELMFLEEP